MDDAVLWRKEPSTCALAYARPPAQMDLMTRAENPLIADERAVSEVVLSDRARCRYARAVWRRWMVHCDQVATSLRCEIFPNDLDATADFYVRVLGFVLERDERRAAQPYLALARDDVRIGAAAGPDVDHAARRPPVGVELVIEVENLDSCHERVMSSGWPIDGALTAQAWGARDFRILDPSGYYLRLTER